MATIVSVTIFFLISIAFGVGVFTYLIDTENFGVGVMKLMTSVCGSCAFIGLIVMQVFAEPTILSTVSVSILVWAFTMIYFFHRDKKAKIMWVLYALHSIAGLVAIYTLSKSTTEYLFLLSSALFLGGITFAMVKGHWYLVNPKLTEKPLVQSVLGIWGLLGVKVIFTGVGVYLGWDFFKEFTTLGEGYLFNWLMLVMRLVWGYIIILVMSVFAWKLVRMRSIQSATGIFYAMVIFVFIGELISGYLFFKYGLYI